MFMSNSVQSLQVAQAQNQTDQTVQPPKKPQETTQATVQQDTVTISKAAQQALATNSKPASSSDAGRNGDN
jgi:hypothetical protein